MWAARRGHVATVTKLLEGGAEPDERDKDGWTALMWAARYGHNDVVDRMLALGVDFAATNYVGESAENVAFSNGYTDTSRLMTRLKM